MATTLVAGRRRRSQLVLRNTMVGWSFLLPNLVGFAVLTLVPIALIFYYAFTNWNVFGGATWSGLDNFRQLIHDDSFYTALWNTLYYSIVHIPLTLAVSLGLALLLNRKLRGVAFFRTVAFFPYITSIVAIATVWNILFSPNTGPVNEILRDIGVAHPPGWTQSTDWSMPAIIIMGTWREMGYYMLLFLAGLQTIPQDLYEAAKVDGTNAWQRFRAVTLPGLRSTMFFVLVVLTIGSLKIFDLIIVTTQGGPGQSTLVLSQYIYQQSFQENHWGYASMISIVLFGVCVLATIALFLVNKWWDGVRRLLAWCWRGFVFAFIPNPWRARWI